MAFTKTPVNSTYDTKRLGFVYNPTHREGSLLNKDAKLCNVLVEVFPSLEKENTKVFVKSRPGCTSYYNTTTGTSRGYYYWTFNSVGYAMSVIGNSFYCNNTFVGTLDTSTGVVGFTEHVDDTGIVTLFVADGTQAYIFTDPLVSPTKVVPSTFTASTTLAVNAKVKPTVSNTFYYKVTSITTGITGGTEPVWPTTLGGTVVSGGVTFTAIEGGFPTPHIPMPVFMDGYVFLAKANTQDIYNCNINEVDLWDSGNFISAEMYPDRLQALTKNNNYLYAIGNTSLEYFYDNAGTTSPLARHDSAVQQFGTPAPASVVATDLEVVLVGETSNGGHTVWTVTGFKAKEIGTSSIRNILRAEGSALSSANAYCVRIGGQKIYLLNLTNITLAYSFDTELWFEWSSGTTGVGQYLGKYGGDGPDGKAGIIGATDGKIYLVSNDVYTDNGNAFLCQIVTPKYDFDTISKKTMGRLSLIGDLPDTSGANNVVQVYWTDDDYNTWVGPRNLSFDFDFPCITQLGQFRRRAFKFTYALPKQLRLEQFEVDINKGNR